MIRFLGSLTWLFRLHPAWRQLEAENRRLQKEVERQSNARRAYQHIIYRSLRLNASDVRELNG